MMKQQPKIKPKAGALDYLYFGSSSEIPWICYFDDEIASSFGGVAKLVFDFLEFPDEISLGGCLVFKGCSLLSYSGGGQL